MRVISGEVKGRRLRSAPGRHVRPTADRVREALFDIVCSRYRVAGTRFLDLFAGTGAVGIEALSRGAAEAVFVERAPSVRRVLEENLRRLGLRARARVIPLPAHRAVARLARAGECFDAVFIDPPYGTDLLVRSLQQLAREKILSDDAWVAAEYGPGLRLSEQYGPLWLTDVRRYGKTRLAFFRPAGDAMPLP